MTTEIEFHPLANMFPLMEGTEFKELVADIKANGQHEAIVTLDGMILDGRNRFRACRAADVEPRLTPYTGDDPLAYVISKNLRRRHLTIKQKRELAAKLLRATPEQSNRQVAEQVRVDHKTVAKVRRDLEGCGEIAHLEIRADTKGRRQPVKKSTPERTKSENTGRVSLHVRLRDARKRIAELEAENLCLREEIAELKQATASPADDGIPDFLRRTARC